MMSVWNISIKRTILEHPESSWHTNTLDEHVFEQFISNSKFHNVFCCNDLIFKNGKVCFQKKKHWCDSECFPQKMSMDQWDHHKSLVGHSSFWPLRLQAWMITWTLCTRYIHSKPRSDPKNNFVIIMKWTNGEQVCYFHNLEYKWPLPLEIFSYVTATFLHILHIL